MTQLISRLHTTSADYQANFAPTTSHWPSNFVSANGTGRRRPAAAHH
ncbi:MAG: hypothetical protein M5U34_46040 [Chloroflexi bacterium]|nr:hypothetical protein [Chloroflexota bacterium]